MSSVNGSRVTFVVPGGIDADTGGNIYDRAVIDELVRRGAEVAVVEPGSELASDVVVVDSLALRAGPPRTDAFVIALVHQLPSEAAGRIASAAEVDAIRRTDLVVTVGRWLAQRLRSLGARAVAVVTPGRDRAWASEGPRADAATVLCVSNAFPGKGLADAIEAFGRASLDGITLRVAGDVSAHADEGERVFRAARASAARVELLGTLDPAALSRLYSESLLLLTASRYEGWPIAVAEAMSSGVPVVGFDVPGVAELVRNGTDGVLVPTGHIDALAGAMGRIVRDPRVRADLGSAARERALAWPTWRESAAAFADLLERSRVR